jgi:ParB/RepB/Spo0J family partition protein
MAKSQSRIALSESRDIPFNRLVLSQSNVRRVKAGVAIEELAEDIARRTLLQSLTVRPVLDEGGAETGMYEVPAGGRRYRALELLVKQKRLPRTAPIPCVVRTGGIAEEDSLAENVQRAPLHPLDQFRAFLALREKGQSEEDIAAAFFVSVAVVRQRLRLASVSPKLLEAYAEDGMTLDQLMCFTINPDHARQEQVWEALQRSPIRQPYQIRRLLTEDAVRASDKRAQFAGIAEYEVAGGIVLRDLFESDDGGWLQDPALLDRLVTEKLEREAKAVRAEGWKWVEVAPDFPYGHTYGLRRLSGKEVPLTKKEAILAAIAVFGLAIFVPGIAAGLITGAPQLGAGAAVATTAAAGGTVVAGGMLTSAAARLAGRASGAAIRSAASLTGTVGAAYQAGGLGGVARATVTAPASRAVASSTGPIRDAYREGAAQGYRDAGPSSGPDPGPPGAGPGGGGPGGSPPAWAQRLARRQRMTQAGLIAAQGLREGDRPALSPGPDLKDKS